MEHMNKPFRVCLLPVLPVVIDKSSLQIRKRSAANRGIEIMTAGVTSICEVYELSLYPKAQNIKEMKGIIGKKIGMTSVFTPDGKQTACTIIEAGPCVVTQVKTKESTATVPYNWHLAKRKKSTPSFRKKSLRQVKHFPQKICKRISRLFH